DVAEHEVADEVVGEPHRAFQLPAADRGLTDVVDHRGDDAGDGRRVLGGDLHVFVRGVEDRGGEVETAVHQRALEAQLEGVDDLRVIAVDGVRIGRGVAAHVEAARLEAAAVRSVGRQVRGDL